MSITYRANVTRITSDGVFVRVPSLGIGYEFGPMPAPSGVLLAVDDAIVVSNVEGTLEDLVIVGGQGGGSGTLDSLSDVVIASPVAGQVLTYNGTVWANVTPVSDLESLTDVDLTSPAADNVLQYNGSQWVNKASIDLTGSAAGTDIFTTKVTGDSQKRHIINSDGVHEWGSGSAASDTNLYRSAASVLATDSAFTAIGNIYTFGAVTANSPISIQTFGDSNAKIKINNSAASGIEMGAGGATALDVNLYRSAANILKTDDAFQAASYAIGTTDIFDKIYPVGSIYISTVNTNPNTLFGIGTWSQIQNQFLVGQGSGTFATAGNTGGAETHTIASGNLPTHTHDAGTLATSNPGTHTHTIEADFDGGSGSTRYTVHRGGGAGTHDSDASSGSGGHTHTFTGATGNGGFANTAVNHLPPYLIVYIWKRTA